MFKFAPQPDDLRQIDRARERRRFAGMRMPFADVAELMQRGFNNAADSGLEAADAALESLRAPPAVFGLGQSVHDVNGFAAHIGDAEQDAARLVRQPAIPKSAEFGKKIVIVGDRPVADGRVMRRGAATLDELDGTGFSDVPDTNDGLVALHRLHEATRAQ